VWFVSESDFWGPKSSFYSEISVFQYSKFLGLVILFRLTKKTAISDNLITPKKKLMFICVLCGSLVIRIFGDKKAVLFRSFGLPIFQIIGTLWFYFVWRKKLLYQPIYLHPNKNSRSFAFCVFVSESDFQGPKSSFIRIFSSSNIPNSLDVVILFRLKKETAISDNLFTPKQKHMFICVFCGWLVNRIFGDQNAVLIRSFGLPIFQILRTLWFYFVWWKKLLYQAIYLRPNKISRSFAFCVVC
jgi:hypothetical protein